MSAIAAFTIAPGATIADAFRRLNENKSGTLFVVEADGRVIGVATDGDIRRRLLVDPDVRASILTAVNRDFRFARPGTPREQVLKLLDARVRVVPCLDEGGRLVDVYSRERFRVEGERRLYARARAPMRISFGGGGTDLTAYFVEHTGVVLNAAITLFAGASLRRLDTPEVKLTSRDLDDTLTVASADALAFDGRLDLLKAVIRVVDPGFGFELQTASDVPVGSGLGGSAVVAAAILGCFNQFREDRWDRRQIAELAFQAERLLLEIPGGWQDQYATVFGGVNFMEFAAEQNVILPLRLDPPIARELEANLVLCWTGRARDGGAIHRAQRADALDDAKRGLAQASKDLTLAMKKSLLRGDLATFGSLLDEGWRLKRGAAGVSDPALDRIYDVARAHGAAGGKLLGAGGGGFFLFYARPFERYRLEAALANEGLTLRSFGLDDSGLQAWTVRASEDLGVIAPGFDIGGFRIGGGRAFVIAEIGVNHNGDLDRALAMIDRAAEAGADCAKFQLRDLEALYRGRSLAGHGDDLSAEYTIDLLRRFQLPPDAHATLAAHCRARGILYLCTPFDEPSVARLEAIGVPAFKVASADLVNLPLIERIADAGKPMLLSTGMSTESEIRATVDALRLRGVPFALLHCNSTYPAAIASINLRYIERLRTIHPLVGYSGHERGTAVSLGAIALGACVLERHVTVDRAMEGPDHAASLTFDDFARLVAGVREIEAALGDGGPRRLSQGELINRENLGKSLIAARDLPAGHVVERADVAVKSPGQGLSPQRLPVLVGATLPRAVKAEDFFFASDLGERAARPRAYRFRRPWGVPIRYHDFARFMEIAAPPLIEFHLSYRDMELDPAAFVRATFPDVEFTVHAPELFRDSRLMDLASADRAYREFSLAETQRVVDIARRLKRFFPKTKAPVVVANVGGYSMDAPLDPAKKPALYARFAESLAELDLEGVRFCPQNMAPFPWHFGGQRHQNIFILPDESAAWCRKLGIQMCVDVSHAQLAANHLGFTLDRYVRTMGPHIAHLHIADAAGVDGEGLQIGEGEIDFDALGRALDEVAAGAGFIPEVWQGHKNDGEGFWIGLDRLEGKL